jgi:hypothetical protein
MILIKTQTQQDTPIQDQEEFTTYDYTVNETISEDESLEISVGIATGYGLVARGAGV